jgi:hypothetical protein
MAMGRVVSSHVLVRLSCGSRATLVPLVRVVRIVRIISPSEE